MENKLNNKNNKNKLNNKNNIDNIDKIDKIDNIDNIDKINNKYIQIDSNIEKQINIQLGIDIDTQLDTQLDTKLDNQLDSELDTELDKLMENIFDKKNEKVLEKVSVIIPSYNRFKYLLNTIKSVKDQTYNNIEIIIVNDCSTEKEYYEYDYKSSFGENFTIINLKENSKTKFGFACSNYVRNQGIQISNCKYIAFCDDDDIWLPNKIELQVNAMERTGCKMSSTDGLIGNGIYNKNKTYKKYNAEHYYDILQNIYKDKGSKLLENGFPEIWDFEFLNIHNCIIASSCVVDKTILIENNCLQNEKNGSGSGDDYPIWLKALEHTNCVYVNDICFYYNDGHSDG